MQIERPRLTAGNLHSSEGVQTSGRQTLTITLTLTSPIDNYRVCRQMVFAQTSRPEQAPFGLCLIRLRKFGLVRCPVTLQLTDFLQNSLENN